MTPSIPSVFDEAAVIPACGFINLFESPETLCSLGNILIFLSSVDTGSFGLINVSNLPRTNFLAIDEGWGTMDSDNINSVYSLFQYLKSQFQFALIVSHIDSMRDAVDSLLEIKKENNFSNINFD